MSEVNVGVIVFLCIFGGSVLGMLLGRMLPEHHLSSDSRDVVKVAMAIIATLAALVLGLLVSSAKSSFDSKNGDLKHTAAQIILLDRTLAAYGPETAETRNLLRQMVAIRLSRLWPEEGAQTMMPGAISEERRQWAAAGGVENIQRKIL